MGEVGLEPTNSNEYQLLRLARLPISPLARSLSEGPPTRDRTWDLLLKRELLYQLSYGRMR